MTGLPGPHWSIRRYGTPHDVEWVILRGNKAVAAAYSQADAEFIMRAFVVDYMAREYDCLFPPRPARSPELTAMMARVAMEPASNPDMIGPTSYGGPGG